MCCIFSRAFMIRPAIGSAALTVTDVINYGSRIGSGLPSAGIAHGAIFAVTGTGLGPDQPVQAGFPLPTSDGLGGVTITIKLGATTANAIMVYVSANEVDAILPSATPLGAATVTVNNGAATVISPITVVQSAFGILANAGAFNMAGDGTIAANNPYQSAQAGQTVMINGTGLGAIASVTIWVGTTQATVVSAGRGACCTGINPNFPIPRGVAAWDVIASAHQFTAPSFITQMLPRSGTLAQGGSGVLNLTATVADLVMIPGVGVTYYFSQASLGTPVVYQ
jgi:uncharacterized protein (TIGR03437 family)